MTPPQLIEALIQQTEKPLTQVATEIGGRGFQGTLYKFVYLGTKSPRHETAARIAKYFSIPLEALYDQAVADRVAREKGLVKAAPAPGGSFPVANEPIPLGYSTKAPRLPAALTRRIEALNTKQFKALENLIATYLDAVAPVEQTPAKQA